MQLQAHGALVAVAVDVIDALSVEARRSPDDAVDLVTLLIGSSGEVTPESVAPSGKVATVVYVV